MAVAAPVALVLLAQAAAQTASPPAPAANAPVARPSATPDRCAPQSSDSNVIVICSERQEGYRINPDVMKAHKEARSAGRPVRPGGKPIPQCTVGPQPCMYGGVNLIGVALTAAEMAKRVASGQEIGSMFQTDPTPSEYQLYQMAKQQREAEEAQKAAEAAAAKAKAAASASAAHIPASVAPQQ